jgi:hypothetical protein
VVPRWIRDVLLRGLRVNPGQRWPSMNVLLVELDKQPALANRSARWPGQRAPRTRG